jgi:hypothetical protein
MSDADLDVVKGYMQALNRGDFDMPLSPSTARFTCAGATASP